MSQSTQSLHESLSAAVDGEAQELELRRVLNAVRDDADLGGKWARLHLIRSVIRSEGASRHYDSSRPWLAEAVPASTTDDAARRRRRWLGPLTGAAVAAAAALMVVVYFGAPDGEPAAQAPVGTLAGAATPPRGLSQVPSEQDLLRANSYLLQHAQHTAVAARPVALPFAKVLTTQDDRLAMPTPRPVAGNDRR